MDKSAISAPTTSLADPLLWVTALVGLLGFIAGIAAVFVAIRANAKSDKANEKMDTANTIADRANILSGQAVAAMQAANELSTKNYEYLLSKERVELEVTGSLVRYTGKSISPGTGLLCTIINRGRRVHIDHAEAVADSTHGPMALEPYCNVVTTPIRLARSTDLILEPGSNLRLMTLRLSDSQIEAFKSATRVRVWTQDRESFFGPFTPHVTEVLTVFPST